MGLAEGQRQWEEIVSDSDNNLASPRASHPAQIQPAAQIPHLAEEVTVNKVLLAPTIAIPHWEPHNIFPAHQHPYGIHTGEADEVWKLLVGWRRQGGATYPSSKLWPQADDMCCVLICVTFGKFCFTSLDLTFQICKQGGAQFQKLCAQF